MAPTHRGPGPCTIGVIPRKMAAIAGALIALTGTASGVRAQWNEADTHTQASFRGLSVAPDGTVWAGGTEGTVMRSTDAGETWQTDTVPGAASYDFRGVAAIDARTAFVAVSAADTARIYRTTDAGASWTLQFNLLQPGVFLDGIGCWTALRCLAAGDPIGGHFFTATTTDGGAHWRARPAAARPTAQTGEAAFAASNTSVVTGPHGHAWIATGGGPVARVWRTADYGASWKVATTPIDAGLPSAGIFSVAFCDSRHGVAVGGDYAKPVGHGAHVAVTSDGGATWTAADTSQETPFLSAATCVSSSGARIISVGPAGTFTSGDGGLTWTSLGDTGYNSVAADRDVLVAVGPHGTAGTAPAAAFAAP
jgi:photosystem II stability/assembly factor-like uncharacterized protein